MCCLSQGLSIACSTPGAIEWDKEWANTHEISGRVMKDVHTSGAGFQDNSNSQPAAHAQVSAEDMWRCGAPFRLAIDLMQAACNIDDARV